MVIIIKRPSGKQGKGTLTRRLEGRGILKAVSEPWPGLAVGGTPACVKVKSTPLCELRVCHLNAGEDSKGCSGALFCTVFVGILLEVVSGCSPDCCWLGLFEAPCIATRLRQCLLYLLLWGLLTLPMVLKL